jgi:hypothetical protein
MASFTLGTAAQATGTAKSTILRAIRAGRISATRDDLGQWVIDPTELNRCFPLLAIPGTEPAIPPEVSPTQPAIEHDAMADVLVAELRAIISDLRRDRDHWREAHERGQAALAEMLAQAQRQLARPVEQDAPEAAPSVEQGAPPAKPKSLWRWLRSTG